MIKLTEEDRWVLRKVKWRAFWRGFSDPLGLRPTPTFTELQKEIDDLRAQYQKTHD